MVDEIILYYDALSKKHQITEVYRLDLRITQRNEALTSKRTQYASIITTSRLMLLHEKVSCNSKNHKEPKLTCVEMSNLFMLRQMLDVVTVRL